MLSMTSQPFVPALRFKSLTRLYDLLIGLTFPEKKIKQALIDQLQLKKNETILDFGCGTGTLAIMIKEQYPLVNITGVDVDEQILAMAEKKMRNAQLNISLSKFDGEDLNFLGNQKFDKILSSLVFHHIPTHVKMKIFYQLFNLLKPGGELHIADFGKAKTLYTKVATALFRRLDGMENTQVNADGLLSAFIRAGGFKKVEHSKYFNTAFGTVDLLKAY